MRRPIRILMIIFLVGVNIGCDQVTKKEVRDRISENQIIGVIDSNFILTKVENTGAALSMGENLAPVFKILGLQILPALVLLVLLFYILKKKSVPKIRLLAFTFVIGGGMGNIIDRILYNSVTDFMYIEMGPFHTGIFNMADVSVTLGAAILLFTSLMEKKGDPKKAVS